MRSSRYALVAALAIALPGIAAGQAFQTANAWTTGNYYAAAGYPAGMPPGYGETYLPNAGYAGYGGYTDNGYAGEGVPAQGYYPAQGQYYPSQPDISYGGPTTACHGADCGHCCGSHCSTGCCLHRSSIFAEFLYWQISDADMPYAVPQDGIGRVGTVPMDDVAELDPDHEAAFRVGGTLALDCQSSITATYTKFETNTHDRLEFPPPFVVQPLVTLPATFNAGATGQLAVAEYSIEFETFDLEYRAVLLSCQKYYVNGMIGGRYGMLDQSFASTFFFAQPDGTTFVNTEIDFDGAGIRTGVDSEYRLCWGLYGYGKAIGSLLGGDFRCNYEQFNQFNDNEGRTRLRESRVVPMLETELGLGWSNHKGTFRLSAGYYFSIWDNVITTREWIGAMQTNDFENLARDTNDDIRLDGLTARAELRL